MKMVYGNTVLLREEAKLARNTHRYRHFQRETSLLSTPLTPQSIKQTTPWAARNICSCDYDMMLGGAAHKSWYVRGAESFAFLND